ncbi:MAG: GAF domain-containing protein [Thermotogaceae bacterium]|nr:GAF domain-containing protein [Thermotogaceae bacterium]
MRSIFRDFTYDFFGILNYPKEQWNDFWVLYRERHPRVLEEYMFKNNLDETLLAQALDGLERREIDRLSHYWETQGPIEKTKVLKELGRMSSQLHLEREDFVIHILGALGKQQHLIVPTSKGNVVMIDLLYCWKENTVRDFLSVVLSALDDFIDYSSMNVRHYMRGSEKAARLKRVFERIDKKVQGHSLEEKLTIVSKLLDKFVDYYNWTGFYLVNNNSLVLGPYVGEPTEHVKINFGSGICGQAAETKRVFLVPDVSKESNYLSCSARTKAEIVLPLLAGGTVIGELDIDSHFQNSFDDLDREFLEKTCRLLIES